MSFKKKSKPNSKLKFIILGIIVILIILMIISFPSNQNLTELVLFS